MNLLLKGGRVIDPSQNIDETMDVLIENGRIALTGTSSKTSSKTDVIDVSGKLITPGLIDMHTHLREPGFEYKETVKSGGEAAVAGGFTSIACMANTEPVNDTRSVTEYILRKAEYAGMANIYPVAAVSKGLKGKTLTEFGDLKEAGAVALSDDGNPVMDSGFMRCALEYAHSLGMTVISHCEDLGLSKNGLMNESFVSTELGLEGIPSIAEEIMVERDIAIAEYTGTSVHISHVSTAGSVRIIENAKSRGVKVTAETAPHYFTLSDESVRNFSTNAKMYPPLRTDEDVRAIKLGLKNGIIDAIATDHAPHSSIEKDVEFQYAANGIIGLETSLPLSLSLVNEGILTISGLIEKMSLMPARILKIERGTLMKGATADVTVIDPDISWTIDPAKFKSKSRNCPFEGMKVNGRAILTIVGGDIKYRYTAHS